MPETHATPISHLSAGLVRELPRNDGRHLARGALFLAFYVVSVTALLRLAGDTSPHTAWRWFAALPCYLLAAASLHGISLFTHEAVHGTLCRSRRWNALLGALCALPVLQNFSAYRVLHLRHHDHLGEADDPDHYPNYTRWSWLVFLMNWGRLLAGYPAYLVAIPVLGWKHGSAATGPASPRKSRSVSAFSPCSGLRFRPPPSFTPGSSPCSSSTRW